MKLTFNNIKKTYRMVDVTCPRCSATGGENCRTRGGRTVYRPHVARQREWCATAVPWAVDRWNERYPVGTMVVAYPGARPAPNTTVPVVTGRTLSKAWILGGHTPVVKVTGHAAAIALTHVDPI